MAGPGEWMSSQGTKRENSSSPEREVSLLAGARLDPPHPMDAGREAASPAVSRAETAPPGPPLAELLPHLQRQAEELAARLRARQQELDGREAALNARQAELDNEVRSARIWLDERRHELTEREASVEQERQALDRRRQELASAEDAQAVAQHDEEKRLEARRQELDRREAAVAQGAERLAAERRAAQAAQEQLAHQRSESEKEFAVQRQQLERRREACLAPARLALLGVERRRQAVECEVAELRAQAERYARQCHQPTPDQRGREAALDQRAAGLAARQDELETAEATLEQSRSELAEWKARLLRREEQVAAQARVDRRRLADMQRRLESEIDARRDALAQQAEQLDHRRAALAQSREEVSRRHREALELRLAAEELQAQLAGVAAPAALARSLAHLRGRLADEHRRTAADLAERQAELETLRQELVCEHEKLRVRQQDLAHWVSQRQAELEQQAAILVGREQELDAQQAHYQGLEQGWREERFQQQQEIRRLQGALRRTERAAPSTH